MDDLTIYKGVFFTVSMEQNQLVIRFTTIEVWYLLLILIVQSSRVDISQFEPNTTLIIPLDRIVMIKAEKLSFMKFLLYSALRS